MTTAVALRPPTVAELLDAQDLVISRVQARRAGLSEDQWQWFLDSGRWQSLLFGVAVAHSGTVTDRQRSWAAVLFAGPGSALSADAALVELGMELDAPRVHHVVVDPGRHMTPQVFAATAGESFRRRVTPHRLAGLDRWRHPARTLPVLRAPAALLHAAAWAPSDRAAEWRLAAAVQQRVVRVPDVRGVLAQMPKLPRRALIGSVLDDVELGAHAASELDLLRLLRRNGLPRPDRLQRLVRTGTRCYLDAWWERQRVALELDGAHHRSAATWEADVLRANGLVLTERHDRLLLLRYTTGNLRHDGPLVVEQLRAALL